MSEIDIIKQQKDEAKLVKEMLDHPGWDIIERDLMSVSRELTSQLLEADNINEVYRLQAQIKMHQAFFDTVAKHYAINTKN